MNRKTITLNSTLFWSNSTSLLKVNDSMIMANSIKPFMDNAAENSLVIERWHVHIALVKSGKANIVVNSEALHVAGNMLIITTANTLCDMKSRSPDFDMQFIDLSVEQLIQVMSSLSMPSAPSFKNSLKLNGEIPPMLMIDRQHYALRLSNAEASIFKNIFNALWQAAESEYDYTVKHLLIGLIGLGRQIYMKSRPKLSGQDKASIAVLNRFLFLVHQHCEKHRTLDFYARELCINKNYMSTLVSTTSKMPASKWIEKITIEKIKNLLANTDLTIYQIADRMNFPEASNLSRFFKRLSGISPNKYRRNMQDT